MRFDPNAMTPEMSIEITLGDFHDTHDKAREAEKLISKGLSKLGRKKLEEALAALKAAQHLSNSERCSAAEDIPQYGKFIRQVQNELKRR